MPWIEIGPDPFRWKPQPLNGRVVIKYKPNKRYFVPTPCAEEAVRTGAAKRIVVRRKAETWPSQQPPES